MKNIMQFSGLSKAISDKTLEPVIDIVGIVKSSEQGEILIDLSMTGNGWRPITDSDVHSEVEHIGERQINENRYAVMRFRLDRNASKELMWAAIQDIQRSLGSMRTAYEAELRSKGHTVMSSDSLALSNCTCNAGDKCCCPDGWTCCNHDKRCCCKSPG